jgi:hypothetical protein
MWKWTSIGRKTYFKLLDKALAVSLEKADEVHSQIIEAIEQVDQMQRYGEKYAADNDYIRRIVTKGKRNFKCTVYYKICSDKLIAVLYIRQSRQKEPTLAELKRYSKN